MHVTRFTKMPYLDTLKVSGALLEAGIRKKSSRIFLDRSRGLKRPKITKKLKWQNIKRSGAKINQKY